MSTFADTLARGLAALDRRPRAALWLGAGIGLGCGAGAALLGPPWGIPLGLLGMGGAAALGLTGQPLAVPLPINEPLVMLELPGGVFWMGSPETEAERYQDEGPRHRERVAPFAMARAPVTQGLYQQVMGENPGEPQGERLPINNVSWHDALRFCNRLSERVGLSPCYAFADEAVTWDRQADGYRLPTEAEWEYAARGGKGTAYFFGERPARLGEYAWFNKNSRGRVQEVERKKPNPFGLHDVLGNVWEWCWDAWVDNYNDRSPDNDGALVSPASSRRVLRGGSFDNGPWVLRTALRFRGRPVDRYWYVGFRCVRPARPSF